MQVIGSASTPTKRGLRSFWPLYVCLVALLLLGGIIWLKWPDLLLQSAIWQKLLHQRLVSLLQQVKAHPLETGGMLMLFSFTYGLLHSAGPGHGKVIIAAYLATHPLKLRSSLWLTIAASVVQGMVAIVLVTVVTFVLQLSSRALHQSSFWMEKGSYLLIVLVGCILCYRAVRSLLAIAKTYRRSGMNIIALRPMDANHVHSDDCGCGHRHLPTQHELSSGSGWKTHLAIIFSIGLRPCSGAILVLLFSKVIDAYYWGMASAMVMAIGTATTISLLALFVHFARRLAERLTSARGHRQSWGRVALASLSLGGGALLILAGLILYYAVSPVAMGGTPVF
ncbi:nickel/cobalt transporter [Budvicia diplopodorum]|uniref:nickel/cobalt transporter n=1 Tax=Budvicia diplopodorum TaxID=1119056 RepID=UPI0013588535|nr:nickel/cobalt transporter [Budvicia diplopodorum]